MQILLNILWMPASGTVFNSLSSIEKRAVEYAKKDINSIEEAKADKKFREGISKSIYKIFGQAPTVPVRKEIAALIKWTDTQL